MQIQISDIFTFDPEHVYQFVLVGGMIIEGMVVEARDNGVVLNTMQHIPTDKILFFVPVNY